MDFILSVNVAEIKNLIRRANKGDQQQVDCVKNAIKEWTKIIFILIEMGEKQNYVKNA